MTTATEHLPAICWVHCAGHIPELVRTVEECDDYCPECVAIVVAELRRRYPEWAEDIYTDGGWDPYRGSDSPAFCERCEQPLSCSCSVGGECIDTLVDWHKAENGP